MLSLNYNMMYNERLESERSSLILVIKVVLYTILAFLIKDLIVNTNAEYILRITLMRGFFVVFTLIMFFKVKNIKTFKQINLITTIWIIIYFAMKLTINIILKSQLSTYLFFDSLIIIIVYTVVPLYLRTKLYLGLFYSIVDLILVFTVSNQLEVNKFNVLFFFISANIIGYYSAMLREQSLMKSFSLQKIERDLLERQKIQLGEIKQLRGLLPICASCKNIRDDKGYWQNVDQYLSKNADLTFTHSICPNCSSDLLAKLDDEES